MKTTGSLRLPIDPYDSDAGEDSGSVINHISSWDGASKDCFENSSTAAALTIQQSVFRAFPDTWRN